MEFYFSLLAEKQSSGLETPEFWVPETMHPNHE
jgi:hypothetical protein